MCLCESGGVSIPIRHPTVSSVVAQFETLHLDRTHPTMSSVFVGSETSELYFPVLYPKSI